VFSWLLRPMRLYIALAALGDAWFAGDTLIDAR
jgi:hypothetical protein